MSDKLSEGTVRDIEKTREDAKLLAECFNSFDDSDSWPGGFTGGTPITTERVLDNLQKKEDIRVLVAEVDGKIVGHCNVCQSDLDPEASYVGLLGVNPTYQKRGFGKAMLIEAAETSANAGKRRVDLHTWGGNLKAMPLYKRVGYNWVPETRVLMESHIPGILNAELFSEFFNRHDWYDSFERDIKQEPDNLEEDGIGVFKYHFVSDGDTLNVVVDREAKGICGFSKTINGETLEAKIKPEKHIGFIGYGEVPFSFSLQNGTNETLSYELAISPRDHFHVKFEHQRKGVLKPGEHIELFGSFAIDGAAEPIDREKDPDLKVKTQAEFKLRIGDRGISLFSALVPTELVEITTNPPYVSLSPGEKRQIGLVLSSNADFPLRGNAEVVSIEDMMMEPMREPIYLASGESMEIPVEMVAQDIGPSEVGSFELAVYALEKGQETPINRKTLSIPIIGPGGAVAYRSPHGFYILETASFRIGINDQPPMAVRRIWHKQANQSFNVWGFLPTLGYPFPSGGSEWDRKQFETKIHNTRDYAELRLTGKSSDKPGCLLDISYKIFPGQDSMEITIEMTNEGNDDLKNLGVRIGGWADIRGRKLFVPLRGKIYRLSSAEWDGNNQLPRKPQEYHENWAALSLHGEKVLIGYLWEEGNDIKELRIQRRGLPYFEYELADLAPSESIKKRLLRIYIGDGDWTKIRNLAAIFNEKRTPKPSSEALQSDLLVHFVSSGNAKGIRAGTPLLLKRNEMTDTLLEIRVLNENPIAMQGKVDLPLGVTLDNKKSFEFHSDKLEIDSPYRMPLELKASSDAEWFRKGGEITLRFQNRIARIPFVAIVHDSHQDVHTETKEVQNTRVQKLLTDRLDIAVSPDYCGGLVRVCPGSSESVFYDTFPEAKPFVWWDSFYSGVSPIIACEGIWDWETAVPKESWKSTQVKLSPWIGYEMASILKHSPGLRGFLWRLRYLVLPGTPLVHLSVKVENRSKKWARFCLGFRGAPRRDGEPLANFVTYFNGKKQCVEPTGTHLSVSSSAEEGWICCLTEPQRIGLISTAKDRETVSIRTLSDRAQIFVLSDQRELYPGEKTVLQGYIILSRNCDEIETLKNLSPLIFK